MEGRAMQRRSIQTTSRGEIWHLTFSSRTRLPLFPTESARRHAVARIRTIANAELLLYDVVDDHLHTTRRSPESMPPSP